MTRWDDRAREFGASHEASWGDFHCMRLEQAVLRKYLPMSGKILDVGCSNGLNAFEAFGCQPDLYIHGIDLSQDMIEQAWERMQSDFPNAERPGRLAFTQGDVLSLPFPDDHFDAAYGVRVLINLEDLNTQRYAILEILRVLKPGGVYVMCEAFKSALLNLNGIRESVGLPVLKEPEFNLYLPYKKVVPPGFTFQTVDRFSSLYYLATRVLAPLAGLEGYDTPLHELAASLTPPAELDVGIQKAYVLRKALK